jgi:tRNA G46 methylase TrmB
MRPFDASKIPVPEAYEDFRLPSGYDAYVLEIGAGAGWHAVSRARAHPREFVMAVEHSHERFAKLEGRAENSFEENARNLLPVHADAESFVVHCLPVNSLDHVFLLYPNPYPKAAQANKRWHNMPFMGALLARLKPGARLDFATNEDFYAAEFFETMLGTWKMKLVAQDRVSREADPDFRPGTHFEKKYYERGEMLHFVTLQKS